MPPTRRSLALIATFVLPSAILLILAQLVYDRYHIEPPDRLPEPARAQVLAHVRAAIEKQPLTSLDHPALAAALGEDRPVVLRLWIDGRSNVRSVGRGKTIAEAVAEAAQSLISVVHDKNRLTPEQRADTRLQVDILSERAPFVDDLLALDWFSLSPGLEGIGVEMSIGDELVLLPDEVGQARLLYTERPMKAMPDFRLGLNRKRTRALFAKQLGLSLDSFEVMSKEYFRIRTDSFVEGPMGEGGRAPSISLVRGAAPPPEKVTAEGLRKAAIAGGRYLVAHLADNGRYIYERDMASGRGTDPERPYPYSLPRHAGTTYFLAELYRLTGEEWLREPIERAFDHFAELVEEGGCSGKTDAGKPFACVHQKGQPYATLGSTALAVVALAEYRRATDSDRYDELLRAMGEWVLMMQRPDGSFAHRYSVSSGERDEKTQLLYFSGEAALALARLHTVFGDELYRDATERALDDLIAWYDFFAGGFFYGEDHWTCIAAEAAWPALKHDRYREFCDGYAEFLRRQQIRATDYDDHPDLDGTYGVTPFILPNNTPVGSRTEAMISSYLLGKYHGKPSAELRQQILRSMRYALGQQIDADVDFWTRAGADAHGGVTANPVDPVVRIDYVQHVCSAMIRTAELMDDSQPRP